MARLYANENFPLLVVEELRRFGHEVLTSAGCSPRIVSPTLPVRSRADRPRAPARLTRPSGGRFTARRGFNKARHRSHRVLPIALLSLPFESSPCRCTGEWLRN